MPPGSASSGPLVKDQKYSEKVPESSKKQKLNLPLEVNYLMTFPLYLRLFTWIYIVLFINLEIIESIRKVLGGLHASTWPFSITELSILRFWYPYGSWNQLPTDTEGWPYFIWMDIYFVSAMRILYFKGLSYSTIVLEFPWIDVKPMSLSGQTSNREKVLKKF